VSQMYSGHAAMLRYHFSVLEPPLVAGWSSRGFKRAGAGDVGEERGQLGRWGAARPALPVTLQACPGAEPRPHVAQCDGPDDPPRGCGTVFSPRPPALR